MNINNISVKLSLWTHEGRLLAIYCIYNVLYVKNNIFYIYNTLYIYRFDTYIDLISKNFIQLVIVLYVYNVSYIYNIL